MERITEKSWANLDPWECCGQDNFCKRGCHDQGGCTNGCIVPKIYARLAAYEDSGFMPNEISGKNMVSADNIPLTYDELRQYCHVCESQFEVKPLYIVRDKINAPHIVIHGWRGVKDVRFAYDNYGNEYSKTWWAYHNEPENGDKHEL